MNFSLSRTAKYIIGGVALTTSSLFLYRRWRARKDFELEYKEYQTEAQNSDLCLKYCKTGDLKGLKYLHENGYSFDDDSYVCYISAGNGHLECLKYLHENGAPWSEETCEYAAERGHLDCLKYLHENGCEWDEWTCRNAALNGHEECLNYARENGCEE